MCVLSAHRRRSISFGPDDKASAKLKPCHVGCILGCVQGTLIAYSLIKVLIPIRTLASPSNSTRTKTYLENSAPNFSLNSLCTHHRNTLRAHTVNTFTWGLEWESWHLKFPPPPTTHRRPRQLAGRLSDERAMAPIAWSRLVVFQSVLHSPRDGVARNTVCLVSQQAARAPSSSLSKHGGSVSQYTARSSSGWSGRRFCGFTLSSTVALDASPPLVVHTATSQGTRPSCAISPRRSRQHRQGSYTPSYENSNPMGMCCIILRNKSGGRFGEN